MDISDAFKTTFKLVFGECNVELSELEPYLLKYHYPVMKRKSSISGKEVALSSSWYAPGSKIISQEEIDFNKHEKLNINDIKDIDSLLEAIKDRTVYAGNKVFGNSKLIYCSDNCTDSYCVHCSHNTFSSKYVAYSSFVRDEVEYVFGTSLFSRSKFLIRVIGAWNLTRAFESYLCRDSSDLFGCFNCSDCFNCMFSFNVRSKRNAIGNLELPADRYAKLREKLVTEAREHIEKHKEFPALFELPELQAAPENLPAIAAAQKKREDLQPIDEAFKSTSRIIFGREIGSLKQNEGFLMESLPKMLTLKTPYGQSIPSSDIYFFSRIPSSRAVGSDEAEQLANLKIELSENQEVSLGSIFKKLKDVGFFGINFFTGKGENNMETMIGYNAVNTYKVFDSTNGKYNACCTVSLNSDYTFGCFRILHSKFCINCHNCAKLTNCFEMDSCTNCRDSMFCHNCENLDNCMFCFNTKSKRYAIGNVEVGRERFMKIKKLVVDEIAKKLEMNGSLGFGICSLGAKFTSI